MHDAARGHAVRGSPLTRSDALLAGLCLAVPLLLYWRTLFPGLLPSDSGELQFLARALGNTHPTGYHVYVLLAYPFTWLPVGDIAYRVNLFSAAMAALAVAEIYLAARLLGARRWAAVLGAGALAVSTTLWSQAVIAEVYAPGAAFSAGVLLALLYWDRTRRTWALWAAGILGGLSTGVHMTVVLLAPAAALFVWLRRRGGGPVWRPALLGAVAGCVLAVGAFLALDARDAPGDFLDIAVYPSRSVWGLEGDDLDSPFERFAYSITARQWRGRMFSDPSTIPAYNLAAYISGWGAEFTLVALLLAIVGGVRLWRRARHDAWLLLGALAVQWIYAFNYDIHDIYVFHITGYLIVALLLSMGAEALAAFVEARRMALAVARAVAILGAVALSAATIWPVLSLRVPDLRAGRPPALSFSGYPSAEGLDAERVSVRLVVQTLPPDAIVFANWYRLYAYYYVAQFDLGRRDLVFIEESPYREGEQSEGSVLEYVEEQLPQRPVFFTTCMPELRAAGYTCWPVPAGTGRLYKVRVRGGG